MASGTRAYARECFEASANRFQQVCRDAIEAAGIHALSESDARVLKLARAIVAVEPFDNGSCALGGKPHRIY